MFLYQYLSYIELDRIHILMSYTFAGLLRVFERVSYNSPLGCASDYNLLSPIV